MNLPQVGLVITATIVLTLAVVAVDARATNVITPEQKTFDDFRKDFQSEIAPIVLRQDNLQSRMTELESLTETTSSDTNENISVILRVAELYAVDSWVLRAVKACPQKNLA